MNLHTLIEQRLQATFAPTSLIVLNESHEHIGHIGSVGGGQHFAVQMKSAAFVALNSVKRHQLVYAALQDLLCEQYSKDHPHLGYIHALKLQLQS